MVKKQMVRKRKLYFVILFIVLFSIIILLGNFNLQTVPTPDYTIRIVSGVIQVYDSASSLIYSGTNPSIVIQYAIDQSGASAVSEATRKTIFVEDGIYNLVDTSTRGVSGSQTDEPGALWFSFPGKNMGGYSYITFEGQSKEGTIFKTNDGAFNAFYLYGKSIEHGDGEDKPNRGLIFKNFQIDGGATSEYPKWNVANGIQTRATWDSLFENLYVTNMGRTAFYNTEHSQRNEWKYNTAYHNYRYGLSYTSSHSGYVHHNNITENQAWGMNWDATFASADNCIFEYNYYKNNVGTDIAMFSEVGAAPLQHGIFRYETIESTLARKSVAIDWITTDFQMYGSTINHGGTEPAVKIEGSNTNGVNFFDNTINAPNANYGLRVGAGNNAKITGNTFIGKNGIIVASGASNTIIGQLSGAPETDKNDFSLVSGIPIENNGIGTIVGGNILPGQVTIYPYPMFTNEATLNNTLLKSDVNPYIVIENRIIQSDVTVIMIQFKDNKLYLLMNGTGTQTITIYTGTLGEPKTIIGAIKLLSTSTTVTIQISFASPISILLDWSIIGGTGGNTGGSGGINYSLTVIVQNGTSKVSNAKVNINSQIYYTNPNGEVIVSLSPGGYLITVTVENLVKALNINLDKNLTVTFDFASISPPVVSPKETTYLDKLFIVFVVIAIFGSILFLKHWKKWKWK